MEIKKICVLGAGIMGAGIAQVSAQAGFDVVIRDMEDRFVENGLTTIKSNLDRAVSKGKLDRGGADAVLNRISGTTDLTKAASEADLVIEAIIEVMDVKRQVFQDLDNICKKETLLATNTSGLSITEMAAVTQRTDKVIGMHFFNPVPVMKLVELIRGFTTSDDTLNMAWEFVEKIDKTPIEVKEAPGFAVNRILVPMINEAVFALAEGVASADDIDKSMMLGPTTRSVRWRWLTWWAWTPFCSCWKDFTGNWEKTIPAGAAAAQNGAGRLSGPQKRQGIL